MFDLFPVFDFFGAGSKPSTALAPINDHPRKELQWPEPYRLPRRGAVEQVVSRMERHHPTGMKEIFTTSHTRMMWED
jgi:hypothetical protein